jgi:hypothetical protein
VYWYVLVFVETTMTTGNMLPGAQDLGVGLYDSAPGFFRLVCESPDEIWINADELEVPGAECIFIDFVRPMSLRPVEYMATFEDGRKIMCSLSPFSIGGSHVLNKRA